MMAVINENAEKTLRRFFLGLRDLAGRGAGL